MMKTIGAAMLVIGAAGWVLGVGAAEPASKTATLPSTQPAKELTLDLGNKVAMKLVLIPAGKFMMGSPDGEKDRSKDEGPQREVTITKPFYMGVYTVTQEQYKQVMGKNPSHMAGAQNPVGMVSWGDAVEFCKKLSTKTGKTVTLPTEAQWEYACRAGSKTRFSYGDDDNKLGDYAWYNKNDDGRTHPVGQKKPNRFGLYDMHGNVQQWCADRYADYYANAKNQDPQGPDSGELRVLRGGYWGSNPGGCRSAYRGGCAPDDQSDAIGFRVSVDLSAAGPATRPATQAATQPATQPGKELTLDLGNKVAMKLVLIPAGKFMMGSPDGEKDRSKDEGPQREVTITKPFYMGVYTVTQEQYEQVMGKNPSKFKGAQNPVEGVSWDEARGFCEKLSEKSGKTVRLPTEAEWEYACRAGSKTRFSYGDDDGKLGDYAWYNKNNHDKTHMVGQKKPNRFGLYDMHGNVPQWCADWYADSYANVKNQDQDPQGPDFGPYHVLRGGGWNDDPFCCRSAYRADGGPGGGIKFYGIRVSVDLE